MSSNDHTLLKHKTELARQDAASLLETLAGQLRSGHFDPAGLSMLMSATAARSPVPDRIHVDVEVKDSPKTAGLKHEIEVEIWWLADGGAVIGAQEVR